MAQNIRKMPMITVAAFYHFAAIEAPAVLRGPLKVFCAQQGLKGTTLLAPEGLNGTMAGTAEGIDALLTFLRALPGFADLEAKLSPAQTMPFQRLKIRLKREIVTMGVPGIDPTLLVGRYIAPADWNALIDDPDVVLIDTRNDFEVQMGSFAGALNPQTQSFGQFPQWLEANRGQLHGKKLAMFCTGGIRCEKATSYARAVGFEDVVHLQGGILKYLETVPEPETRWHGRCFVFDERESLGQGLSLT
jgi:UPF0176 protein